MGFLAILVRLAGYFDQMAHRPRRHSKVVRHHPHQQPEEKQLLIPPDRRLRILPGENHTPDRKRIVDRSVYKADHS